MKKKSISCFIRKILGIGFSAVLLLMLSVVFFVFPSSASADTISLSPDGTNNNEIKINKAINDLSLLSSPTNRGIVHLNPGTYKILSQIVVKQNVILEGRDSTTVIFAEVGINPKRSGCTGYCTSDGRILWYPMIQVQGDNIEIRNLAINGNSKNVGLGGGNLVLNAIGFWAQGADPDPNNLTIRNINICDMPDDGIIGAGNNIIIDNINCKELGHTAVDLGGGSYKTKGYNISNIKAVGLGNAGIRLFSVSNVNIKNVDIKRAANQGFEIWQDTKSYWTDSVYVENFTYEPLLWGNGYSGINAILINHFFSKGYPADASWHIKNINFKNVIINQKNIGAVDGMYAFTQKNITNSVIPNTIFIRNAKDVTFDGLILYNAYASNWNGTSIGHAIHVEDEGWVTGEHSKITIKNSIIEKSGGIGIFGTPDIDWHINNNVIRGHAKGSFGGSAVAGTGNIDSDPLFAYLDSGDPTKYSTNDFHLQSPYGRWKDTGFVYTDTKTSPCIGAGDPTSDNTKSPCGGTIEMGAYGNTTEASKTRAGCIPTVVRMSSLEPQALSGIKLTVKGSLLKIEGLSEGASGAIFDVRGAIVSKIYGTNADDGSFSMRLSSAGVYFVKLNNRGKGPAGKVYPVLMR